MRRITAAGLLTHTDKVRRSCRTTGKRNLARLPDQWSPVAHAHARSHSTTGQGRAVTESRTHGQENELGHYRKGALLACFQKRAWHLVEQKGALVYLWYSRIVCGTVDVRLRTHLG